MELLRPRMAAGKALRLAGLAALALASGSCESPAGSEARFPTSEPPVLDGTHPGTNSRRFIVRMRDAWGAPGVGRPGEAALRAMTGEESRIEPIHDSLYAIEIPPTQSPEEALRKLKESGKVALIEEDFIVTRFERPNDPQYSQQWAHPIVKSEEAWDISEGSDQVVVAVVDTGIDHSHPDLAANMWRNPGETPGNGRDDDGNGYVDDVHGFDFANGDGDPMADDAPHFHGTHVAGTIGAIGNNRVGVVGHAPKVKLMAIKFLTAQGTGHVSHAIRGIYYAVANGAKIISNSWGGPQHSQELSNAIDYARQRGVLFVVAAGNGGQDGIGDNNDQLPTYPAAYTHSNMITVAATGRSDELTRFSNFGSRTVHVGAPGENIYSTRNGSSYQFMSGTSMATPLISGVLATMIARRPDLGFPEIKKALLDSVDVTNGLRGRVASNGRVNAYRALSAISGGDPGPNPTPTPTPTTTPTPDPTNTPPPGQSIAPTPFIAGYHHLRVANPYMALPIDYDVSAFAGATGAYLEVSRPGTPFSNPNGNSPDPARWTYAFMQGTRNRVFLTPAGLLPGWGIYQVRVIPLNASGAAAGLFSNPAVLELRP